MSFFFFFSFRIGKWFVAVVQRIYIAGPIFTLSTSIISPQGHRSLLSEVFPHVAFISSPYLSGSTGCSASNVITVLFSRARRFSLARKIYSLFAVMCLQW